MDVYNEASSKASAFARSRLQSQLSRGEEEENRLIELVSTMVITDAKVYPRKMAFHWDKKLLVSLHPTRPLLGVHSHALSQMCGVFEYPKTYLNKLTHAKGCAGIPVSKCRAKLVEDLNWHSKNMAKLDRRGNDARYWCRYVGDEMRGFLTMSFNRKLATKPLLRAFTKACAQVGAKPVEAHASPVRFNLHCVLPIVFEPYPGEFVTAGTAFSNSDFGGGKLKIATFMRRVNGSASTVLDETLSAVHIGPVVEDEDVELDDDAKSAELTAAKKAVTSAVVQQLKAPVINNLMEGVRLAQEEEVPWHRLKAELSRILHEKELTSVKDKLLNSRDDGFEELPPVEFEDDDEPVATRWWAAAAIGQLAEREDNSERRKDLQELSGKVLGKTKGFKQQVKSG
jgi:hypothetical protein